MLFDTRYLQALVLEPCFLFDLTTACPDVYVIVMCYLLFCTVVLNLLN